MSTETPAPASRPFGLVETTIIVILLGVTALFAIPRYEARGEERLVNQATRYAQWVAARQLHRLRSGEDYAAHLEVLTPAGHAERPVPEDFVVADLKVDGRRNWMMVLRRRPEDSAFGAYEIVWDSQGFNPQRSSVPRALLPARLHDQWEPGSAPPSSTVRPSRAER